MRLLASMLLFLLPTGCDTGIVVHDGPRAAELVVDCLSAFKSSKGIRLAYEWADDNYHKKISFSKFSRIVSSIRNANRGADIRLAGFETFGAKEEIIVYANSKIGTANMYFKFTLGGTKHKDYYLVDLSVSDSGFDKHGIYQEYLQSIVVQGV